MTLFKKQNYYERLEIEPSASPFEICQAYRRTLQIYGDESMASYSFFSETERKNILALLDEAFSTLVNEQVRGEYDQQLIRTGDLKEECCYRKVMREPVPIFAQLQTESMPLPIEARPDLSGNPNLKNILAQETLAGRDLQQIRMELGLSLEQIAARIKVRTIFLRHIEEDQFDRLPSRFHLKSFLTQYVQCLQIDTASVVERYLKRIRD
ncbi:MAG: helix-turn-helix domain-containing protein [Pseudomonadota bacterium]